MNALDPAGAAPDARRRRKSSVVPRSEADDEEVRLAVVHAARPLSATLAGILAVLNLLRCRARKHSAMRRSSWSRGREESLLKLYFCGETGTTVQPRMPAAAIVTGTERVGLTTRRRKEARLRL